MARGTNYSIISGLVIVSLLGSAQIAFAAPFVLTNGPGDGTVTLGVNGFGGFGSFNGPDSSDAFFDPAGAVAPAKTTLASAIAIRSGPGPWSFLTSGTDIFGSGGLPNPPVGGSSTSGTSSFSSNGLNFNLVQTLTKTFSGTTLTQTYTITNPTSSTINFDLLRYLDGDLFFDGSILDGGGHLINLGGIEILFETDALGDASTSSSTFVGITTDEGTEITSDRFEIDAFPTLGSKIVALGTPLANSVFNDNADPDLFIDIPYDVSLALSNDGFSLNGGESVVYVTKTVFGDGAPEDVVIDPPTELIGGMIFPVDTMALLIAGAQSTTWLIPIFLSFVGIGLVLVKRRLH